MDIEERAEKWAREKLAQERALSSVQDIHPWLVAAYLAGSAQTQRDYTVGRTCCPRCVCTCGAR